MENQMQKDNYEIVHYRVSDHENKCFKVWTAFNVHNKIHVREKKSLVTEHDLCFRKFQGYTYFNIYMELEYNSPGFAVWAKTELKGRRFRAQALLKFAKPGGVREKDFANKALELRP